MVLRSVRGGKRARATAELNPVLQRRLRTGSLAMKNKLAIAGGAALLCVVFVGLVGLAGRERLSSKARKEWKEKAIAEITQRTGNAALLAKEIDSLKTKPSVESEWDRWISEDLILMTNDEWMVYRNICAKEKRRIPDLFIGHASDGKWYYSTYHFCIGMIVLKTMMDQPESLAKFRDECYLREFDGHSDECLKKTWPPKR